MSPPCPSCPTLGDTPVPLTSPLSPAVPADLRPRGGQWPHRRLRAGGHRGGPDAPQRPSDPGTGPPAPVRALDHRQWGMAGDSRGPVGLGHPGDPPDRPPVPPQKHTDELQAQAEASLLGLVCHLYQVGQGPGGTTGLGDTSPSLLGLSWLCSGRGRSLKSVGAPRPRSSRLAAGTEGCWRRRESTIKKIFLLKTTRSWSAVVGGAGRG